MKDISLFEKMDLNNNSFPIKFLDITNCTSILPHWHEHTEFLFFAHTAEVFCDGKKFNVKSGDLICANAGEVHSLTSDTATAFYVLIVSPIILSDVDFKDITIENHIQNSNFVHESFNKLKDEYAEWQTGSDIAVKGIVYTLIAHLVKNHSIRSNAASEKQKREIQRLNNALNFIDEHYNERITSKMLSEMSYVTESYFCRFFKKATGVTVTDYLNEFRIQKAMYLLKNTNEGILNISEEVGFYDTNYFSRVFKRFTGMTPTQFRATQHPQFLQ